MYKLYIKWLLLIFNWLYVFRELYIMNNLFNDLINKLKLCSNMLLFYKVYILLIY